jgi:hypothetical protein
MIKNYLRASIFFRCMFMVLSILFFHSGHLYAQAKVLYVKPGQTDPAIKEVHGPHVAVFDPQATPRHRLFLFIPGTGAKAKNSLAMDRVFAKWGFHAISLDYENNVIAVACAHSLDPATFGRYRNAIVTGASVSDMVKVNAANSILNRFQKLLVYLVKHDPHEGWGQFVKDGKPVWSRIIVAGHSQGSGHAGYIGKMFDVDRVLMFSGPQDYMDDLHKPAPWQGDKSATPPSRFFAFLSRNDPFNVHHQIANCMMLMQLSKPRTLAVKPGEAIHGDYQIFINDFPKKHAHGSTLSPQFTNVWQYMVTANGK